MGRLRWWAVSSVVVSKTVLDITEGGEASYTVKLSSKPFANVSVFIVSNDTRVTLSVAELLFSPSTWNTEITVRVFALSDGIDPVSVARRCPCCRCASVQLRVWLAVQGEVFTPCALVHQVYSRQESYNSTTPPTVCVLLLVLVLLSLLLLLVVDGRCCSWHGARLACALQVAVRMGNVDVAALLVVGPRKRLTLYESVPIEVGVLSMASCRRARCRVTSSACGAQLSVSLESQPSANVIVNATVNDTSYVSLLDGAVVFTPTTWSSVRTFRLVSRPIAPLEFIQVRSRSATAVGLFQRRVRLWESARVSRLHRRCVCRPTFCFDAPARTRCTTTSRWSS